MELQAFLHEAASRQSGDHVKCSVQELLGYWGYRVRDFDSVPHIEEELSAAGLTTDPPFARAPNGAVIRLVPVDTAAPEATEQLAEEADVEEFTFPQASLLIRDIPPAAAGVVSVSPHDSLLLARTKLMGDACSQVAVLAAPNDLRGAVTWESIAKAAVTASDPTLKDATEDAEVVKLNADLLAALPKIYGAGYAFTLDEEMRVCGLVTALDLSQRFETLVRPFFLIGEVERRLRNRIGERFSSDDVRAAFPRGKTASAEYFMFSHYERFLADGERWRRLDWACDHDYFLERLRAVRLTRNAVMHFDAKPLTDEQLTVLENFAKLLRRLDPLP